MASQSVSLGHQPCSVQYKSTVGRCAGHFLPAPVPHTAYALGCGWRFHTVTRGRSLGLLMKKFSFAVAQFLQLVCRQCECNTFVSSQCSHMSENHCQNLLWLHAVGWPPRALLKGHRCHPQMRSQLGAGCAGWAWLACQVHCQHIIFGVEKDQVRGNIAVDGWSKLRTAIWSAQIPYGLNFSPASGASYIPALLTRCPTEVLCHRAVVFWLCAMVRAKWERWESSESFQHCICCVR